MQHLVTLDLDELPALRVQHPRLANIRAVAVFIDDATENDAFDEDTSETRVVLLSERDLAHAE